MASTSEAPSLGLTPPYRIGQSSTHVYVEAHCADTPSNVQPEAACDDTIFALRCPPYYLPLHFPAPLKPTLAIHRQGSVVRVDLEKETADLDFVGLDDLQPTLFVEDDGRGPSRPRQGDEKEGAEANELLASVLDREKMTEVDEGSEKEKKKKRKAMLSPLEMDEATRRANVQSAEQQEDEAFDEQGYLDAYVDEDGYVAELERAQWSTDDDASSSSGQPVPLPILLDLLLAYHLALIQLGGPPLASSSAHLLCSLSRTLARPSPAPPASPQEAVRSAFRRGLTFAPHRSWRLCERALRDAHATLQRGALAGMLRDIDECLRLAGQEEPEGPAEAERCRELREALTRGRTVGELGGLADEVGAMLAQIDSAKTHVGPKWDLELLEKMADEVVEEESGGATRLAPEEERIAQLCVSLEPPRDLAIRLEDSAGLSSGPSSPAQDEKLQQWRTIDAPRLLRDLERQMALLTVRRKTRKRAQVDTEAGTTQTSARVFIAASRFIDATIPWSSGISQLIARRILTHLSAPLATIESVLSTYIRPLFLSIDGGGSVDEATGRLRRDRVGMAAAQGRAGDADEVPWKTKQAGVHSTLQACLEAVARLHSEQATPSLWSHLWPLLLPPLLTLAEDPSPPWRLRGAQLIVTHLLAPYPLRLLRAANLVPHLREVLESDLTYLSSPSGVGVKLLDVALEGLRDLAEHDETQLMRLIQEGVLRVWSMAPASLTALDVDITPEDLLSTTFRHLSLLLKQLGSPYAARYIDVALEVLLASVAAVQVDEDEAPTVGSRARAKARTARRSKRATEALRAEQALLEGCCATSSSLPSRPPGLSRWTGRALGAHVRAWLALSDDVEEELREELRQSWKMWQRVSSLPREGAALTVEEMEQRVLAALVDEEAEDVRRGLFGE